ncbi:NR LBD domain-containing protein [Caenorhabditis elegans]|nr:NR LBD domain-containing protein [Caenorhabditis elegans]CAH2176116.1 NR LBD domain-containing protein [Caenorhabditis elegans]
MSLSIFNFAVFLFCHEELAITEEKVRKHIGEVMLDTAFTVLEEASESDLRGEVGQLFSDILERLAELEVLNERVPLFLMKYLDKIRCAEDYEGWKGRVIDCKCCIMDLRGRVDWYSVKTLKESRQLLPKFTDPEQHELGQLFTIFDKLPRVN